MFKKKYHRRSKNPIFILFRLMLSLVMFAVLLAGSYSAYKHFSGVDPLKLDPKQLLSILSSVKLTQGLSARINEKILGQSVQNEKTSEKSADFINGKKFVFRFLLVTDSHSDNIDLKKAIDQAKAKYPDLSFIIGLGDYTQVGTVDEFKKTKNELDLSGLRYFLIPGDHDLWNSRDKQLDPVAYFKEVFGPPYQSFVLDNFKFILLYNSDNYIGLSNDQITWLTDELEKAKQQAGTFVFVHEPLYHPSSDHVMGHIEKKLKQQAKTLTYQLRDAGVKKVFAGDIHYFSEYEEPDTKLSMVTVGAITIDENPQSPRFAVANVFEDGSIKVEDMEIK